MCKLQYNHLNVVESDVCWKVHAVEWCWMSCLRGYRSGRGEFSCFRKKPGNFHSSLLGANHAACWGKLDYCDKGPYCIQVIKQVDDQLIG